MHDSGTRAPAATIALGWTLTGLASARQGAPPAFDASLLAIRARGTIVQVNVASQASFPSTYALPAILPARVRNAHHAHFDRIWSPGIIGRRNLALSMPEKTVSLVPDRHLGQHHHRPGLGHRLHHEHAGHDG